MRRIGTGYAMWAKGSSIGGIFHQRFAVDPKAFGPVSTIARPGDGT